MHQNMHGGIKKHLKCSTDVLGIESMGTWRVSLHVALKPYEAHKKTGVHVNYLHFSMCIKCRKRVGN